MASFTFTHWTEVAWTSSQQAYICHCILTCQSQSSYSKVPNVTSPPFHCSPLPFLLLETLELLFCVLINRRAWHLSLSVFKWDHSVANGYFSTGEMCTKRTDSWVGILIVRVNTHNSFHSIPPSCLYSQVTVLVSQDYSEASIRLWRVFDLFLRVCWCQPHSKWRRGGSCRHTISSTFSRVLLCDILFCCADQ